MPARVGLLGGDRIDEVDAQARRMVAEGRGKELMVLPGWWWVITAESYLDYASQLPDVLALAPRITCPVLYIRGDKEPAHVYPAEDFAARAGGPCDVRIVKDCDHFYGGREDTISEIVTRLARTRRAGENLISRRAGLTRHTAARTTAERPRIKQPGGSSWHCIAEPC